MQQRELTLHPLVLFGAFFAYALAEAADTPHSSAPLVNPLLSPRIGDMCAVQI